MSYDLPEFEKRLQARLAELQEHSLKTKESRQPVELDQTLQGRLSRQDAIMQQAMAEATERNRHVEIQKIEAALNRIENGEFGYCISCGEEILGKRLENDPAVPSCITCAGKR